MALIDKKRKAEQNGGSSSSAAASDEADTPKLLPADARRLLDPLSKEQLLVILKDAACRHVDVLDAVRSPTDGDVSARKLFVRCLSWDTTVDGLRAAFSAYGDIQEATVILDKSTRKSKGYGFVTFRQVHGALLALKEPSKPIDGRMTVTQICSACTVPPADLLQRKIHVAGILDDMPAERLLQHFLQYGEIEEGPIGYDNMLMESKGYVFFVYKTREGADAAITERVKEIDDHILICKRAKGGGLPVASSGADTVPDYGAIPGSIDRLSGLSSFDDVGARSHYSPSSNLPSSLGVQSSGLKDAMFDLPPSPGRGAGFGGGFSSSSQFAGIGCGGLGAGAYDGLGYGGGAHYQLGSSGSTSGGGAHYQLGSSGSTSGGGAHYQLGSSGITSGGGAHYQLGSSGITSGAGAHYQLGSSGISSGGGAHYQLGSSGFTSGAGAHYQLGSSGITSGGGAHYQLGSSGITSGGDCGYPSLALRGQHRQPPRSPPEYRIHPRGSMYQ